MKNISLIILALSLSGVSFTSAFSMEDTKVDNTVYISPFKPLLFIDDHVSEGFLVPLNDGRMLLIFRLDPGIKGSHVGNDGFLAQIYYDPEKDQWGEVKTLYNSHRYDDRNVHGGITGEGRIVVFFRRYESGIADADGPVEGRYFIYSDDNGQTWSDLQLNKAMNDSRVKNLKRGNMSTGQMFYNPDIGKYTKLGWICKRPEEETTYRYTLYSLDGSSWDEYNIYPVDSDYSLNEFSGAWCGDGRIIALHRDDRRRHGHPLVQVESYDNGQTWTEPVQTNIPPKLHWGSAPQVIYNRQRDLLIAMNGDRYSRPDAENSIFIYTARPDEVLGNPQGWTLQHEIRRPWAAADFDGDRPLNSTTYGYPTIAPISDDEYLVVFTERARMHGAEQADLYYFRMIIK